MKLLCLLPLLFPLTVLASEADRQAYACDNGSALTISFNADGDGRPQAILHFSDEAVTLPQVPTATGTLFRSGNIRLQTLENEVILEDSQGNQRRCAHASQPPGNTNPPAAASSLLEINGKVTYPTRLALPPHALLTIVIKNHKGQPLVEQRYELNGATPPIPFTAHLDRDLLGPAPRLLATARIEVRGQRRYANPRPAPVALTEQTVDLALQPVRRSAAR